jgi:chemosensory pili system protein ChpA (sensor histidine kinase/response regulator)
VKRILIVDGDPDSRAMYGLMLRHHGYGVEEVEDGAAALRRLQEEEFAAVVCELALKRLDGHALLQRVRAEQRLRDLCVVVLTTLVVPEERERAERGGCTVFLGKPLAPRELVQALDRALAPAEGGRAPGSWERGPGPWDG